MAQLFTGPINYQTADGSYAEIDPTLVPTPGGYTNASNAFSLFFPATYSQATPVRIDYPEGSVATTLMGANQASAAVDRTLVTYRGARPFTDLIYASTATGVKETLMLKDVRAQMHFSYRIDTPGLNLVTGPGDAITILSGEDPIGTIPPVIAEDAGGVEVVLPVELRELGVSSYQLDFDLPRPWLDDPDRELPVAIDPSFVRSQNAGGGIGALPLLKDTAVLSHQPTVANYQSRFLNPGERRIDRHLSTGRAFLTFDVREEVRKVGHLIYRADFDVYRESGFNDAPQPLEVRRITDAWDETVTTWNARPPTHSDVWASNSECGRPFSDHELAGDPNPDCTGWLRFDVESLLQWWIDHPNDPSGDPALLGSNHGFALRGIEDGQENWVRLYSKEAPDIDPSLAESIPYMVVVANAQPSTTSFTLEDWASGEFPKVDLPDGWLDNATVKTTRPELKVSDLSDENLDPIVVRFQVASKTGGAFEDRLWHDSGWIDQTDSYRIPAGVLEDGSSYEWRVQAADVCEGEYEVFGIPEGALTLCDPKDQGWPTSEVRSLTVDTDPSFRGVDRRWAMWSERLGNDLDLRVNLASGNLNLRYPLDEIATAAGPLGIGLAYNSHSAIDSDETDSGLGRGWRISVGPSSVVDQLPLRVESAPGAAEVVLASGRRDFYIKGSGNVYSAIGPFAGTLVRLGLGWRFTTHSGGSYLFDDDGALTRARPSTASPTSPGFTYDVDPATQRIEWVEDPAGRRVDLVWDPAPGVALRIDGIGGTIWSLREDGSGRLTEVEDPTGAKVGFSYCATGDASCTGTDPDTAEATPLLVGISDGVVDESAINYRDYPSHPDGHLVDEISLPGASAPWGFGYQDGSDPGSAIFTRRVADRTAVTDPLGYGGSDDEDHQTITDFNTGGLPLQVSGPRVEIEDPEDGKVEVWPITRLAWDANGNLVCRRAPSANPEPSSEACESGDGLNHKTEYQQRAPHLVTKTTSAGPEAGASGKRLVTTYSYDEGFSGLQAQYFSDSDLQELPDEHAIVLEVDERWGTRAPPGLPGPDFSARFFGEIHADHEAGSETYSLQVTRADSDNVRVAVGDEVVIDCWPGASGCEQADVDLEPGWEPIVVEFADVGDDAAISLAWKPPGASSFTVVPEGSLRPDTDALTSVEVGIEADRAAFSKTTYTYASDLAKIAGLPDNERTVGGTATPATVARELSFTYDGFGRIETETDGTGEAITHVHGTGAQSHCAVATIDRVDLRVDRTCSAAGDTTSESFTVDGVLHKSTYSHDSLGREVATNQLIGGSLQPVAESSYDDAGRLQSEMTRASGSEARIVDYAYTRPGSGVSLQVTTVLPDPDYGGPKTRPAVVERYDDAGNLIWSRDALGGITTATYDARDQVVSVTDPSNETVTSAYDADGNRVRTTDPAGVSARRAFDKAGFLSARWIEGSGRAELPATTFERDARGAATRRAEPDGSYLKRSYDAFGAIVTERSPVGPGGAEETRTFTYDDTGFLTEARDFTEDATTFGRDDMGRLTSVTAPHEAPNTSRYTRDAAGQLEHVELPTTPGGAPVTTTYDYDERGLPGKRSPTGSATPPPTATTAPGNRSRRRTREASRSPIPTTAGATGSPPRRPTPSRERRSAPRPSPTTPTATCSLRSTPRRTSPRPTILPAASTGSTSAAPCRATTTTPPGASRRSPTRPGRRALTTTASGASLRLPIP